MTEKEFLELRAMLDEEFFKPFFQEIHKKGQERFNKLILDGWGTDEALYDLITKTAYMTLRDAVSIAVFICSDIEPDKPKTREELKSILKVIKTED